MSMKLSAPRQITWFVCLALYVVALMAHFGVMVIRGDVAVWSWILGFGILLIAAQIRKL